MTFAAKHILVSVAVDPSDDLSIAEHLVDAMSDLALAFQGRLTIAYAAVPRIPGIPAMPETPAPVVEAMQESLRHSRSRAEQNLEALARRAQARGVAAEALMIDAVAGIGETIAAAANERQADLIALSSHGRRGLQRLLLGSVADRVAHLSTVPVFLLRAHP
jgi:nucleotide-binding universal stress UspA family protein